MGPLVFFVAPNDPHFLETLDRILKSPSKGGLTSAGFVFRYDTDKVDDGKAAHSCLPAKPSCDLSHPYLRPALTSILGVGGGEGTFKICTM